MTTSISIPTPGGDLGISTGGVQNEKAWARKQRDWQRENYQKSIQWRVQDALQAGVHPLFALGAGTSGAGTPPALVGNSNGASFSAISGEAKRNARLQNDFLEEQILASRQARLQNAALSVENTPQADMQIPSPPKAHPTHFQKRDFVDSDGKLHSGMIPQGTPASVLEEDIGDIGAFLLSSPRVLETLQNAFKEWVDGYSEARARSIGKKEHQTKKYSGDKYRDFNTKGWRKEGGFTIRERVSIPFWESRK
jgi:hypothetical protein